MKTKCPYCNQEIELDDKKLQYHKDYGRVGKCPKCNKKITIRTPASNMTRDENGTLRRKYKPRQK